MRSFADRRGGHWQVALLDASYGNILAVFSRIGDDEIRKASLDAVNICEAEQWLAEIDEAGLNATLADTAPWQ